MIHNNEDYPSRPHKYFDIYLPSFGKCYIELRPFEDDDLPPIVHITDCENNDVCYIELRRYNIEFAKDRGYTEDDINIICKFMSSNFNEPWCGISNFPIYDMLKRLWYTFNGPEDGHVKFPKVNPYDI